MMFECRVTLVHKIRDLVVYRDILSVFRALHNPIAPLAIRSLFAPRSTISHRVTRATTAGTLQLPPFRLSLTRRTFSYRAAMSWNCLPSTISGSPSRAELIRRLDMHAVCQKVEKTDILVVFQVSLLFLCVMCLVICLSSLSFLYLFIVTYWYAYVFLCHSPFSHEPDIKPPRGMVHF